MIRTSFCFPIGLCLDPVSVFNVYALTLLFRRGTYIAYPLTSNNDNNKSVTHSFILVGFEFV